MVTEDSRRSRLLQLADVVTGCTTALVCGEEAWAPALFSSIKPLLDGSETRKGGVGLKIHPDLLYANLYHWLLGDTHLWKGSTGFGLPRSGLPYGTSPVVP
jgi:hypothetical protein